MGLRRRFAFSFGSWFRRSWQEAFEREDVPARHPSSPPGGSVSDFGKEDNIVEPELCHTRPSKSF